MYDMFPKAVTPLAFPRIPGRLSESKICVVQALKQITISYPSITCTNYSNAALFERVRHIMVNESPESL